MLEKIKEPKDLKNLNIDELYCLADEIRSFLVKHISKAGGHLAANLGVVELTIALFLEFDPYSDRIVWDVGHQSYVHKILTGRADRFDTLRKYGGLSGFPKISESMSDAFNSGHSSTSISAAAGFAAAARLNKTDERAVAVIGDGAMTGGMAFEAMNHAGSAKLPITVILNDNGMSISKNVSALSNRLKKIRSTARYFRLKSNVKSTLDRIPIIGAPMKRFISDTKSKVRGIILPNTIFEDFGFKYLGPVDGHNIENLRAALSQAKEMNEPVLIHIHTKKGKGYAPAEKNPDFFHGVQSFDESTGIPKNVLGETWSDCFGNAMCKMAEKNPRLAAITAAMPLGTGLADFSKRFPDRFFDVAIAEQHAVTFSAGLAKSGITPVAAIYSTFLQRAYDQIIHDVSLMKLHVVFAIDRCGPVGSDGETHQGVYDIAYMSQMPGMTVFSPSNKLDFIDMLDFAVNKMNSPAAVRYPRGEVCDEAVERLSPYKPRLVRDGGDVLIAAVGITVRDAVEAAEILEKNGVSAAVADMRCIKPIDVDFMKENSANKRIVASVEDGIATGGFGQQLAALLMQPVMNFAYPDVPIVQGSVSELKQKYGMDAESIAGEILKVLK